jgi:hypothetical protein
MFNGNYCLLSISAKVHLSFGKTKFFRPRHKKKVRFPLGGERDASMVMAQRAGANPATKFTSVPREGLRK